MEIELGKQHSNAMQDSYAFPLRRVGTRKMIDAECLLTDRGILTILKDDEIEMIEKILFGLLGCS